MTVIDTRRYEYDDNFNIVRERTKEEIKIIELKDARTAHREWLEHLEDLILRVAYEARDTLMGAGSPSAIQDAINGYHSDMENL